ncbi:MULTISPECIES: phosphoribosylformylglycinamidine cyclo-ligase [unclassified Gemella]|uniref:phosphoribosylformylglycinamidine cyclo-ligase n=1 Tax=unclassified Gemella TaxID=2624949 RepID=UPI001C05E6DE|nr:MULTISPECIES: phosphoribosylformylglycinamidine cyclo-ligase [unclassified Gemella]MBU0278986.1 phosphoribosylformylglycinamidine cyclo-ligase [Gemella sp. zg-1178]QWQ38750.1 phosphoribosylformylglycinamidine cyclo-ligase [Gemella sp. zg-570]
MASERYANSGVSLTAGYNSVERIKKHIERTKNKGAVDFFGSFGGVFDLTKYGYTSPVLVSGTDGVGTKLMLAFMADKHDTIGQDAVAMCVNDIIAQGADPLFFLDYIACGKNFPEKIEEIVKGVADACVLSEAALIGGETAEMPDMYSIEDYDIAGFAVGACNKEDLIDTDNVKAGQAIIGFASSGFHSNGYSLVRSVLFKENNFDINQTYGLSEKLGNLLLEPTKIYVKLIKAIKEQVKLTGMAHITGGGFHENIPRCLGQYGAKIDVTQVKVPEIIDFVIDKGNIDRAEAYNIFNMGIGFIVIVADKDVDKVLSIAKEQGEVAYKLGHVVEKQGVEINGI